MRSETYSYFIERDDLPKVLAVIKLKWVLVKSRATQRYPTRSNVKVHPMSEGALLIYEKLQQVVALKLIDLIRYIP